jgi:hypothetical protein
MRCKGVEHPWHSIGLASSLLLRGGEPPTLTRTTARWRRGRTLDSCPLYGTGRVQDLDNLVGHVLRQALRVIARQQGWGLVELTGAAGATVVTGSPLQAAWDLHGGRWIPLHPFGVPLVSHSIGVCGPANPGRWRTAIIQTTRGGLL